jgi:hypothetical protein
VIGAVDMGAKHHQSLLPCNSHSEGPAAGISTLPKYSQLINHGDWDTSPVLGPEVV